jgi:hypothetical protein
MKKFIKKLLVTLSITLLTTTTSSSSTISSGIERDSIVSITPTQLKETNLIFAEHHKLLIENQLLSEQLNNYKEDNKLLVKADSVRQAQIKVYKDWNESLTKNLNKKKKTLFLWKIGGITVSSGLLLLLLIK